jgi:hypothetical protein
MRDRGHHFAPTGGGQFSEECGCDLTCHVGKGIAVEEEERSAAMALPQELYSLFE